MLDPRTFRLAGLCLVFGILQFTNAASYSCPCGYKSTRVTYDCGFWGLSRCSRYITSTKMCQCVDGGWSDYTTWQESSPCSVSCDSGYRTMSRSRTCNNPAQAYKGKECDGSTTESKTESCNTQQCPVDGGWSDYTTWQESSPCSVSCDSGYRTMLRSRTCNNPAQAYKGKECDGSTTESKTESCNTQQCPVDGGWTEFGNWVATECSVSCGDGGERSLSRSRTCTSPMPNYDGKPCEGVSTESKKEPCNSNPCPIDGGWTDFGNWVAAECSVSCGGGERSLSRSRTCTSPMPNYDGKQCEGVSTASKKEPCNSNPCPIDGGWTEFEEWIPTTCSLSCGEGQRSLSRSRTCTNPPPQYDGKPCEGVDSETNTETCNSNPCPIDGVWCDFNELAWTSCSAQCNKTGTQTRVCDCPPAQHGGAPCDGSDTYTETMDCYEGACLVQTCDAADKPSSSLPRNCGEYVRCDTNPEPLVMPCPAGLHFDDATGVCVAGDCGEIAEDEVDSPCNSDNNGAFVADDVDCTVFYLCSNGVATPMSCPAGTMWDASVTTCVHGNCQVEVDDDVEDEEEDGAACANRDDGTMLPDPEDCHKFIMCDNKEDKSKLCAGSLVFDPNISACNWESVTNPCTTKP